MTLRIAPTEEMTDAGTDAGRRRACSFGGLTLFLDFRWAVNQSITKRPIPLPAVMPTRSHGLEPSRHSLFRRMEWTWAENRQRLEELMALQHRMERALDEWAERPDGVPDGHSGRHARAHDMMGEGFPGIGAGMWLL